MIDCEPNPKKIPIPHKMYQLQMQQLLQQQKDPTRDKGFAAQKARCEIGESRPPLQMLIYVRLLLSQRR